MNAFPPDPLQAGTGTPDSLLRPPRVPMLLVLLNGALGGIAIALAVNEDFASGKAAFASDAWRALLGLIGAGLAFTAVRGLFRKLNQSVTTITEERRRRARFGGKLLLVAGAGFLAWSTSDELAVRSIAFDSWANVLFLWGGIYLALMGLLLQLNHDGAFARQRLAQGQGTPGVATILSSSDTGMIVADKSHVRIEVELEIEGRKVAVGPQRLAMEQEKLALLIPGSTLDVLVDRANPNVFEIDWDSWRGPGTA